MARDSRKVPFKKPSLNCGEQIALLKGRGLIVDDEARAFRYLTFIGYYRLMVYGRVCQPRAHEGDHHFAHGTTFDHVLKLYSFDRELRAFVLDALERIEVSLKAAISNEMCNQYGPHWYLDEERFHGSYGHRAFLKHVEERLGLGNKESQKQFIAHYFSKYSDPRLPPSWMLFEVLTFGTVSRIFQNLHKSDQSLIAKHFELSPKVLISWIRALAGLRNVCAHHEVLWNRRFTVNQPMVAKKFTELMPDNTQLYTHLVIIKYMLSRIAGSSRWAKRLRHLVKIEAPHLHATNVAEVAGFPRDWEKLPIWELGKSQS